MPEMIYVDSSNIEAIGYESTTQDLHVRFLSGGYYVYHQVPEHVFDAMIQAASKGSFLNREIKGVYGFAKM